MNSLTIGHFPPLSYACGEAINTLCTNLSFSGENIRKIMVTSCHAAEGKSYISMNIMRTMAKFGKSVVLVDADLRRSMISAKYSLQFCKMNNGVTTICSILYHYSALYIVLFLCELIPNWISLPMRFLASYLFRLHVK